MKFRAILYPLLCLALITPAAAQYLYENGPVNGTIDAWTISSGFVVSDSFFLPQSNVVGGIGFWAWLLPGDVLQSVNLSITSSENGGTVYFNNVVTATQGACFENPEGFSVCVEALPVGTNGLGLDSGTYWLNLSNATVGNGDPVYWDENSGVGCMSPGCPSSASENELGTIPSEAFSVAGGTVTSSSGTTPEPGTLSLFLTSGILAGLGLLRRS